MKKYAILVYVGICACAIGGSAALLFAPPILAASAPYYLADCQGKLALYSADSHNKVIQYEIYTHLLPPPDVSALRKGVAVNTPEELHALLEDYGL